MYSLVGIAGITKGLWQYRKLEKIGKKGWKIIWDG
jgi:hypothetical protein